MGRDHCVELGAFGAGREVLNTERLKVGKHPRIEPTVCRAGHVMADENLGHSRIQGHNFCQACRIIAQRRCYWRKMLRTYFDNKYSTNTNGFHCADCEARALVAAA